ncbi:MAG: hypothetical protein ABFE01_29600, partial [Phycisphaerales bacterium]
PVAVARRDILAATNKGGPKGPWRWTEEAIREKADSLARFFDEDPEALYLESWCVQERIPVQYIRYFSQNEYFASVLERVLAVQGSRLLEMSSRTIKDERGSSYYKLNPRVAILVLQCRHGYTTQQELIVSTPLHSEYERTEAARKALESAMPAALPEAREWLTKISLDGTDEATKTAAEQLLTKMDIEQDVERAGSALCDV